MKPDLRPTKLQSFDTQTAVFSLYGYILISLLVSVDFQDSIDAQLYALNT